MTAEKTAAKVADGFFTRPLTEADPELYGSIHSELSRQQNQIELIASENIVSRAVLEAQGSVMTNKYAEGYPHRRYYGGCEYVDVAEDLALERVKKLFNCTWANVQPHSGSQANQAVFMSLMQPGDTFLGLDLTAGGHLTHGSKVNQSGKWFNAVSYGLDPATEQIDFDQVESLAREHKPKLILVGGSAYPRVIDFVRFRKIADEVGAYLMVDMAHFAGLVAGGVHPNPCDHADVVTSTTHKTVRGPRGGMILSNNLDLSKKFNSTVFPGLQGGPLMHVIAAKAVAFGEALTLEFKIYSKAMVENARALAERLTGHGFAIVSGGTDTHLMLVDLRPKGITGNLAEEALDRAGITCNKNSIPNDPEKPMVTSGVRLGSPAATTRGFGIAEFHQVADWIDEVLVDLAANGEEGNGGLEARVRGEVKALCDRFPVYPDL